MPSALVAALLVVVVPGCLLAARVPALRTPSARRVGLVLGGCVLAAAAPWGGADFAYLKRLTLGLALAATGYCVLRARGRRWELPPRRRLAVLAVLAGATALVYSNFFAFHGARTFVHLHDVAHYYLGAKYAEEVGYTHLYTAMLRAEAAYGNRFHTLEARDLETYRLVHVRTLLERSEPVKRAFTPERWEAWKADVRVFRDGLGPLWAKVLADHGYNPTPVWTLIGGTLAQWVPAGSATGVLALALLDPLLLVVSFGAVAWAFGAEAALLAAIHLGVVYGASFGWTGGAFLRYLWFASTVAAFCLTRRGHPAPAGAALALATALRVFPAAFAAPVALGVGAAWVAGRRPARRHLVFLGSYVAALALWVGATATLPRGLGHWAEFRANMSRHVENISPNVVGLLDLTAYRAGPAEVTQEEFEALKERRTRIYHGQLVLVFLPTLWWVARTARRSSDVEAMLLGLPLVFTGLTLAAYYYALLVLVTLARSHRPRDLAVLFGLEAATHGLLLFEDREAMIHVWRSAMVLELVVWLWLPELLGDLGRAAARLRSDPSRRALETAP